MNEEHPEAFERPGLRCNLTFIDSYHDGYAYFTVWLEHALSNGDSFDWGFVRTKLQTHSYYVDHIQHAFDGGKQTVTLRAGTFNSYRKMLYDKACFLNLLSIRERFNLTDNELDHLLIHRVEYKRSGYPESLSYLELRKFKY